MRQVAVNSHERRKAFQRGAELTETRRHGRFDIVIVEFQDMRKKCPN
jgi:hypothetical protein